MSIDFTKPLQTRDGRKVRLLCTDAQEPYPVVILYEDTKDTGLRTLDGKCLVGISCAADLMNVPEQVTVDVWVNIYLPLNWDSVVACVVYGTKESAKKGRKGNAITVHIKRTVPVGHVDE